MLIRLVRDYLMTDTIKSTQVSAESEVCYRLANTALLIIQMLVTLTT